MNLDGTRSNILVCPKDGLTILAGIVLLDPHVACGFEPSELPEPGWGLVTVDGSEQHQSISSDHLRILLALRFPFGETIGFKPFFIAIHPLRRNVRAKPLTGNSCQHIEGCSHGLPNGLQTMKNSNSP